MKLLIIVIVAGSLIALGFISKKTNKATEWKNETGSKEGSYAPVAVLELFTSEGCSSCPPADNLLPELAKLDANVIPLSFHVDYWNRLGWTDPFSNNRFSERQREYGEQLHLESIYTPQLVVNGEYELVGSNSALATSSIKKALMEKATVKININKVVNKNGTLFINCTVDGDIKKVDLIATIVQKQAMMNVKAGENKGLKLIHTNVVRSFFQKPAQQKMEFEMSLPKDLADDNKEIILYARQKNDLKIIGATIYQQ